MRENTILSSPFSKSHDFSNSKSGIALQQSDGRLAPKVGSPAQKSLSDAALLSALEAVTAKMERLGRLSEEICELRAQAEQLTREKARLESAMLLLERRLRESLESERDAPISSKIFLP
jgi:predicted RNase H-like nuclease (RuvC/YqgF family)